MDLHIGKDWRAPLRSTGFGYGQANGKFNGRGPAILAAEAHPRHARHLLRCLTRLRFRVHLATSPEQVLDLSRRAVFHQAVVGVELSVSDEPLLGRLARLPAMQHVVVMGPAGDPTTEVLARSAGAHIYLVRPVTTERLARALRAFIPRAPPNSATPFRCG